jgi:hypothetical protein
MLVQRSPIENEISLREMLGSSLQLNLPTVPAPPTNCNTGKIQNQDGSKMGRENAHVLPWKNGKFRRNQRH